jgi:7-carboxy-7-deazaguanine synthase
MKVIKEGKSAEIFNSCQGEGKYVGKFVTFLRLAGCNCRCSFCDTSYAQEGKFIELTPEELAKKVMPYLNETRVLCITGGEPTLQCDELVDFISTLKLDEVNIPSTNKNGENKLKLIKIMVETNGSLPVNMKLMNLVDTFSVAPKLAYMNKKYFDNLIDISKQANNIYFKVVGDKTNFEEVEDFIIKLRSKCDATIYFQPMWDTETEYAVKCKEVFELFKKSEINKYTIFLPQMHKFIWGNRRRV